MQEPADGDMSRLLGALLPVAQESLEKHGAFYPFGASISALDQLLLSGIDVTGDTRASGELEGSVIRVLARLAGSGQIRASGVCTNVSVGPDGASGTDAVRFCLEHVSGLSIECLLPYTISGDGTVQFGEISAQNRAARIFTADPGADGPGYLAR